MDVRRSSRRTTSVEPPATGRTRATRSQSVESSVPNKQAARAGKVESGNRATRASRKNNNKAADLPIVVEDDAAEEVPAADTPVDAVDRVDDDGEDDDAENAELEDQKNGRLSLNSTYSGTTYISNADNTQTSEDDTAGLDKQRMVRNLGDLYFVSDRIIDMLARKPLSKERPHNAWFSVLDDTRTVFSNRDYISVDLVLRTLFGVTSVADISASISQRPDAILYQANIASLAKQIFLLDHKSDDAFNVLVQEDKSFPGPYVRDVPEGSELFERTFDIALELRTQVAILRMIKGQDPDAELRSVFLINGKTYRGWDGLGFTDVEIPGDVQDKIDKRMREIRWSLNGQPTLNVEWLEESFPWDGFVRKLLKWVKTCSFQLRQEIEQLGGSESIQHALHDALLDDQSPAEEGEEEEEDSQDVTAASIPTDNDGPSSNAMKRFARLYKSMPESGQKSLEAEEEQTPVLPERLMEPLEFLSQKAKQENENRQKENRPVSSTAPRRAFIEPQPDAQRIQFDDSQPSSQPRSTAKASLKRARPASDSDSDSFETDDRPDRTEARRKAAPVSKRARRATSSPDDAADQVRSETDDSEPRPSKQLREAQKLARKINSGPITRRRWSDEEVDQLYKGMARFGHEKQRYAAIKEWDDVNGGILAERDGPALKDKVVNIIKALMKSDPDRKNLPSGFEYVSIGKFHEDQIPSKRR